MTISKTPPKRRFKEGDIVLSTVPQVDGEQKLRPVLILRKMPTGHFLCCAITTQLAKIIPQLEEIVYLSDDDFSKTGLKKDSLIRLTWLALIQPNDRDTHYIGYINSNLHQKLLSNLAKYLIQDTDR
jgi:mRNA interferase MazF